MHAWHFHVPDRHLGDWQALPQSTKSLIRISNLPMAIISSIESYFLNGKNLLLSPSNPVQQAQWIQHINATRQP